MSDQTVEDILSHEKRRAEREASLIHARLIRAYSRFMDQNGNDFDQSFSLSFGLYPIETFIPALFEHYLNAELFESFALRAVVTMKQGSKGERRVVVTIPGGQSSKG